MKPTSRGLTLLAALVLALTAACGSDSGDDAAGDSTPPATPVTEALTATVDEETLADHSGHETNSTAASQIAGRQLQQNLIPDPDASGWQGAVLPEPVPKPDFTLTDTDGDAFDFRADTADADVTFLYFGYTTCPDICPLHMASIATALRSAPADVADEVEVVFVSVDPSNDEPLLRQYLDSFDPSFTGLIGSAEEVNRIMADIGLIPSAIADSSGYPPSHPVNIIAFTGDESRLAYPTSVPGSLIAEDLTQIATEGPPA
ncbi:SCO family protein [Euzebya tangerina]|uniref:SCO family protein n=1 Tax=Euzebya tangerina TaxID=591198 RepID=UPI0013C2DF61|nr:SCO family protein [Euzebya tangerina]